MSKRHNFADSNRRNFLKGAGLVSATALTPLAASAQVSAPKQKLKASVPGPTQIAVETLPPSKDPVNQTSSGGDFMVDVLKTLNFDYLTMNCASAFRGIHESFINYGKNTKPEILTCPHEEIAVHMAQGYAQDGRQADGDDVPRHRGPAAREHGVVQRLVRPGAGLCHDRQHNRGG
jgi:acetolactate synthase-1/2/3 large subunit